MSDWDGARYHRVSEPQFDWGQRVIARLRPRRGERILDLGCGTGRITREIQAQVAGAADGAEAPAAAAARRRGGAVIGLDRSAAMLAVARLSEEMSHGSRVRYVQASGDALPFRRAFDAIFSAATLHWIPTHDRLFASIHDALRPAGRFVAQAGGKGNLARLLSRAAALMAAPPFAPFFRDWTDPWQFADAETTAGRLRGAGFVEVETWMEEAPVDLGQPDAFGEFVAVVCLRHHLDCLPLDLRQPFVGELTTEAARDRAPFVLDYWRLNIAARRAAS